MLPVPTALTAATLAASVATTLAAPSAPAPPSGSRTVTASCVPVGVALPATPAAAPVPYSCPVPGLPASLFDAPQTRYSAGHRGIDLLSAPGEPVRSPAAGVISFAGRVADRPLVVVDHGGGWRTTLEPVAPTVARGTAVAAGQEVGRLDVAAGHCAPRSCLHLGVRGPAGVGGGYVDPLSLLRRRRVVLLPVG